MPTANVKNFRIQIVHSMYVKRLENTFALKIGRLSSGADSTLFKKLIGSDLLNMPNTAINRALYKKEVARALIAITSSDNKLYKRLKKDLLNVAKNENKFMKDSLKESIPLKTNPLLISDNILRTAVTTNPIEGQILKDYFNSFSVAKKTRVSKAMRQAYFNDEGPAGLTRRLLSPQGGALKLNNRQAMAIARTSLNHAVNQTRDRFDDKNNYAKKVRYTAVIDGRTTFICGGRDGMQFSKRDKPVLPAHYNCRSIYVAVIDGFDLVGNRSAITSKLTRQKLNTRLRKGTGGSRAKFKANQAAWIKKNVGTIPAKTNFNNFLKNSPARFQKEFLGPSRYRLFNQGKLDLNKFTDMVTGRRLTLRELKASNKKAFSLAGID